MRIVLRTLCGAERMLEIRRDWLPETWEVALYPPRRASVLTEMAQAGMLSADTAMNSMRRTTFRRERSDAPEDRRWRSLPLYVEVPEPRDAPRVGRLILGMNTTRGDRVVIAGSSIYVVGDGRPYVALEHPNIVVGEGEELRLSVVGGALRITQSVSSPTGVESAVAMREVRDRQVQYMYGGIDRSFLGVPIIVDQSMPAGTARIGNVTIENIGVVVNWLHRLASCLDYLIRGVKSMRDAAIRELSSAIGVVAALLHLRRLAALLGAISEIPAGDCPTTSRRAYLLEMD